LLATLQASGGTTVTDDEVLLLRGDILDTFCAIFEENQKMKE